MKKDRVQDQFLKELKHVPIVQVACERCGLSRQSVYRWRQEDPEFESLMNRALSEGEMLVNDMCESQLLSLIKDKNFSAVRFWLTQRHPKYIKPIRVAQEIDTFNPKTVIDEIGLTDEDFSDENIDRTTELICKHLLTHQY